MIPKTLSEIQQRFLQSIMQPVDAELVDAAAIVTPSAHLSASARLAIYREQYWLRLKESIAEDFPGLNAIIGDDQFDQLLEAYLTEHPSSSFSLRDLGCKLPDFVRSHPDLVGSNARLCEQTARFEWAQVVAFDSAALPIFDPSNLTEELVSSAQIRLQPYVVLLDLDFALDEFEFAPTRADSSNAIEAAQCCADRREPVATVPVEERIQLAVHRMPDNDIYFKRLAPDQFKLLQAISSGATIGAALSAVTATPDEVHGWLAEGMSLGWFC